MTTFPDKIRQLVQIKADLKAAIEARDVDMTDKSFAEYADSIAEIGVIYSIFVNVVDDSILYLPESINFNDQVSIIDAIIPSELA